jgi:phosphoglycolate phosphatase-like HAD superfamily hydrolase
MTITVFISDLDGTLIDTRERAIQAHVDALQTIDYAVEANQIRSLYRFSLNSRDLLSRLNLQLSESEFIKYVHGFRDSFYENWQLSEVFPGAIEALQKVQSQVEYMRLITSRHYTEQTRREIQRFGLHRYFDKILTRGDLAHAEGTDRIPLIPFLPQRRRLIQLALQDIKADGEVWVVGDSVNEIKAAQSLGFVAIGVLTGYSTKDDLAPFAEHIINSISEIVQLI